MMRSFLLTLAMMLPAFAPASGQDFRVLVFSKTTGFRHESIPGGITLIQSLGAAHGFSVNTTGEVLSSSQQAAFEDYIRGGGGWVGVHSAADTEYDWPFYGQLLGGAWFLSHPPIQTARIRVMDAVHPSTRHYPANFFFTDEWYNFRANPRGSVDRKSTRLNSSHSQISYAVFCLKKKKK